MTTLHNYYSVENALSVSEGAATEHQSISPSVSAELLADHPYLVQLGTIDTANHIGFEKIASETELVRSGSGFQLKDPKYRLGLQVFLAVSVVSALLALALEAFMFGVITKHRKEFDQDLRYFETAIYLSLFAFAAIYQVLITLVGLYSKNVLLLSLLCVFYACMLVYTGIQYHEISSRFFIADSRNWQRATYATNIATICVLAATFVVQVLLIYFQLWQSVRWYRFKKIGASFEIKRLYSYFQVHRSLLMFDFFFFLGFTVQFLVIMVRDRTSVEFILTCLMLPLTILVLYASDYAATREWVWLTCTTTAFFLAGCVYVLFKVIRLYTKYTSAYDIAMVPGSYFPGRTSLVSFGVITLLFLAATLVMEGFMIRGYNRGLLPLLNLPEPPRAENKEAVQEMDLID